MIQRIYRLLFVLFIAAGASRMSAQTASNEVGIWVVSPQLSETTLLDTEEDVRLDFDEDIGFGASFNHFWTDSISTDFTLHNFSSDMTVHVDDEPTATIGEISVLTFTAMPQFHFNRAGKFSVYVGAGGAWVSGEFEPNEDLDNDDESIDLESELTWAAGVGADYRITDSISIGGDVKYISWDAIAEGQEDGEALELDPLTFSAGLKFLF